ncbi:hypothetical protein EYB25_000708 [Talaromyces marneffei]|nr:hypothetical protein EYB25_000708 [Talaromyces marneffei]
MSPRTKHVNSEPPKLGVQKAAVLAGGFLSGAMMNIAMISVPVFMDTNKTATHMVAQWSRTYDYGHIILPGICIGTCGLPHYSVTRPVYMDRDDSDQQHAVRTRGRRERFGHGAGAGADS